jgi:homocysteine S-methyltransferase
MLSSPQSNATIVLTDSAMGTALPVDRFPDGLGPWWASSIVISHPELICHIHEQNLDAGSDMILTATYQAFSSVPEALRRRPDGSHLVVPTYEESDLRDVCKKATQLAELALAKQSKGHPHAEAELPRIGLSVGPIGSALPGGLEFTGNYPVDRNAAREFYFPKLSFLMESWLECGEARGCTDRSSDGVIVFETFPRLDEALFALELFEELAIAVMTPSTLARWACTISFVTHDGVHLPCGASIDAVLGALEPFLNSRILKGVGVNCSYSLSAESAAMRLLSSTFRVSSTTCTSCCYLVWKPNASPEALPSSFQQCATSILEDFKASTLRVAERVVLNHQHNQQQDVSSIERHLFRFDKLLCGGCCGTTSDEVRWFADMRSSLSNFES